MPSVAQKRCMLKLPNDHKETYGKMNACCASSMTRFYTHSIFFLVWHEMTNYVVSSWESEHWQHLSRLKERHPDRYCTARNHQFDSWQSGAYFIFSVMHLSRALNGLNSGRARKNKVRTFGSIVAGFHAKPTKLSFYPLRSLWVPFTGFKNLIGHFRVRLNLSFKASLSAKFLLW